MSDPRPNDNPAPDDPADPAFQRARMAEFLDDLAHYRMPFGRFKERRLHNLPLEYLLWFKHRGFPNGKLGRLMAQVCSIKSEGADFIFDRLRKS